MKIALTVALTLAMVPTAYAADFDDDTLVRGMTMMLDGHPPILSSQIVTMKVCQESLKDNLTEIKAADDGKKSFMIACVPVDMTGSGRFEHLPSEYYIAE